VVDDNRGFEIKTLRTGDNPNWRGFGLEVIDGGLRGGENKLVFSRGNEKGDGDLVETAYIRCTPGARIVSDFDAVKLLPLAQNGSDIDAVTVKLYTKPLGVFTDVHGIGMHRKRCLARSNTGVIAAGAAVKLYESHDDNGSAVIHDEYHTDSRMSDRGFFDGFVRADQTFEIWIVAAVTSTPSVPGTYYGIIAATAVLRTMPAGIADATHVTAYTYNFTWGSTGLTSTVGIPVPCPGTPFEIWLVNTSVGNLSGSYSIGLRGSL